MTEEIPSAPEPEKLTTVEEEINEYKDKYLRSLADIENMRKRMQKEAQENTRFAVENVLAEVLDPIDNLENALKMAENLSAEMKNWAQGFLMILGQFKEVLSNHGVNPFNSEGERFDPQLHYAIETEQSSEAEEGTILKEYVKGYRSKERTIRPARVKVAVAPEPQASE